MPASVLALAGLGLLTAGFLAPPRRAFALLAGVVLLIPATLVVPNGLTSVPTFIWVVTVAIGAGMVLRAGVRSGPGGVFAITPVHVAAALYALGILLTGVVLAGPAASPDDPLLAWLRQVEPLVVFVVALACARAVGTPRYLVQVLAAVAGAAIAIGFVEHLSGHSWGHLLFGGRATAGSGSAALPLETRDNVTRIRAGEEFALAYAWVLAALVPAVVAVRVRRLSTVIPVVGLLGCVLAAYWSFSRSAAAAFAVAFVVLGVAMRSRRLAAGLVAASLALLAAGLLVPAVTHRFSRDVDVGALLVRGARRPAVLEAVADRPLQGLGLTGVSQLGIGETDQTYLLAYGETGVIGVVLLLGAVTCGLLVAGRGLLGPPGPARTASAVAVAGASVLTVGGVAFDALSVRGTADLLWLLVAVGVAGSETSRGRLGWALPPPRTLAMRAGGVVAAVAVGGAVAAFWPSHVAVTARFATLSATRDAGQYDPVDSGRKLVATTCAVAEAVQRRTPGANVDCRAVEPAAGFGVLRVEAGSGSQATQTLLTIITVTRERTRVPAMRLSVVSPPQRGQPTAARTAPVSAGLVALLLALLVPVKGGGPGTRRRPESARGGDLLPGATPTGSAAA